MDDEDEFVDAVEERDDEELEDKGDGGEEKKADDEGFGDDDFGDFGDFEEQQQATDEVVDYDEECDPHPENFRQRNEGLRIQHSSSVPPLIESEVPEIVTPIAPSS